MSTHGNDLPMVEIAPAQATDIPSLFALLDYCGLPTAGLDAHLDTTLVARDTDKHLVGSAGLELYGTVALLRSVAVAPHLRGKRLGERLVLAALDLARQRGIDEVYLLTETARDFFPRFGFIPIPRDEVSPALHQSAEWTTACPTSAQAMVKRLAAQP
jgi:amino-acid N-acetyltransferase